MPLDIFLFSSNPPPSHPISFQSDSCLGNHGKSSLSETDVPFSWKLECVKKKTTHETQIISKFSGGEKEMGGGLEGEDNGREKGSVPPLPLSYLQQQW